MHRFSVWDSLLVAEGGDYAAFDTVLPRLPGCAQGRDVAQCRRGNYLFCKRGET